jgi:hypothetical protein
LKLFFVLPGQIDDWELTIRPLLNRAADDSGERYTAEDILHRAKEGDMQIWVVMDDHILKALCVTEVTQYPKCKEMCIVIMTGYEMHLWTFLLERLENIARESGCKRFKGYARPGWEKILRPYGYQKTHVILEKDL